MANRIFKEKLRKIRAENARRTATHLQERTEEDMAHSDQTVATFNYRERVESLIDDLIQNFCKEAPQFSLSRGFFDGYYSLTTKTEETLIDSEGSSRSYFSRIMLLLNPQMEAQTFSIECRKTVRDVDLETVREETAMNDGGIATLGKFAENQFIEFAESYFSETELSEPVETPVG